MEIFTDFTVTPFSGVPRIFLWGGIGQGFFSELVQQIQLMAEGKENGDLGSVAP
jgi:hypothetical protein